MTRTKNVSKRYLDGKLKRDPRNSLVFHVMFQPEKDKIEYHEYSIDKKNGTSITLRCKYNRHGMAVSEKAEVHHCGARLSIKLGNKIKTVKRHELKKILAKK